MKYDVFISHSSLDKDSVARPLTHALENHGLSVWLDEGQLHVGDSIRRDIENALKHSQFLVPILSPTYLQSEWCQKELDAFFTKEKQQSKSILPVYHGVDIQEIEHHWLFLADKVALNTDLSIEALAENINNSIRKTPKSDKSHILQKIFKSAWWPSANWQWLLGMVIATIVGLMPIIMSGDPKGNTISTGQISNSTVTFDQSTKIINNKGLNEDDSDALARKLFNKMDLLSKEKLRAKDQEIKSLSETISRLKNKPNDEYKQDAVKKLEEGKPAEAALLLRKLLVEQTKVLNEHTASMSKEWVDLGNITSLTDPKEAQKAYLEAVRFDSDNLEAWRRLGNIQRRLGMLEKAEASYLTALDINKRLGRKSGIACQLGNIGLIYESQGKLDKAEEQFLKALKIGKSLKNYGCISRQYSLLASLAYSRGHKNEAEEFLLKSLKTSEAHGLKGSMALSYTNLSNIYYERRDLEKAKIYAQKSTDLNKFTDDKVSQAASLGMLALIAIAESNSDKAEKFLLRALTISESISDFKQIIQYNSKLGFAYLAKGHLSKSEAYYLKALKMSKDTNDKTGIASQYHGLGRVYEESKRLDGAEKHYMSALKVQRELGRKHDEADLYIHLGSINKSRYDLKAACTYWKKGADLFRDLESHRLQQSLTFLGMHCIKIQ